MPHEETRKIIRVGNSFAVTMPCAWLRYFNLSAQDKVKVVSNGLVVIEPLNRTDSLKMKGAKRHASK